MSLSSIHGDSLGAIKRIDGDSEAGGVVTMVTALQLLRFFDAVVFDSHLCYLKK